MVVDGIDTDFLDINIGVPQGGGAFLSLLMFNDINLEDSERSLLVLTSSQVI